MSETREESQDWRKKMGLKAVRNMTIEEVENEIKQTNEDPKHPYWIDHPKHETAVDRMMDLLTTLSKKLYPPKESKYPNLPRSPLRDLVNFLNIDFESSLAWERWRICRRSISTEKTDQVDELKRARDLQSEIKNDLSSIADWKPIPEEKSAYDERWDELCEKLNEMKFRRYWRVDFMAPRQGKAVPVPKFKSWNLTTNDREDWYAVVGYLLENGEIERLRKCSFCRTFFEARDKRQFFCQTRGTRCKDDYHKRTAAERMRKSREKSRQAEKEMARREKRKLREQKEKALGEKFRALVDEMEKAKKDSLVTKLGKGQYSVGWNTVLSWANQIKRGASPKGILGDLSKGVKTILTDYLNAPEP